MLKNIIIKSNQLYYYFFHLKHRLDFDLNNHHFHIDQRHQGTTSTNASIISLQRNDRTDGMVYTILNELKSWCVLFLNIKLIIL